MTLSRLWIVTAITAVLSASHLSAVEKPKKIVFLAGKKSHGPGHHEYEKGLRLLKKCIAKSANLHGYISELHLNGWPKDEKTLDDADTIVLFSDGSDRNEKAHPLLHGNRLEVISKQMKRGCGFVAIHYTVFVPNKRGGKELLQWLGGYFDYQSGTGPRGWYSKITTAKTKVKVPSPEHPISRGLKPFELREEYYHHIRMVQGDKRVTAILSTPIPREQDDQVVAWAVQRKDGGRGFGFTGGHFHSNWQVEPFRKMVLNAIVWTAGGKVPEGGVKSNLPGD